MRKTVKTFTQASLSGYGANLLFTTTKLEPRFFFFFFLPIHPGMWLSHSFEFDSQMTDVTAATCNSPTAEAAW